MNNKVFAVYIMGNNRPTLYTGMTGNLLRRLYEHKNNLVEGFTKKYQLHKLLYYEYIETAEGAAIREKQIKDMNRNDKLLMIQKYNPQFQDLSNEIEG
jgi:putative endonuclease